jgi:hypothetical protein
VADVGGILEVSRLEHLDKRQLSSKKASPLNEAVWASYRLICPFMVGFQMSSPARLDDSEGPQTREENREWISSFHSRQPVQSMIHTICSSTLRPRLRIIASTYASHVVIAEH